MPGSRAAAALLIGVALLAACRAGTSVSAPTIGEGVREALLRDGRVHVMIALDPPPAHGRAGADAGALRSAIAELQEIVEQAMDSTHFRTRQRYADVPALAATVLTEEGLERLAELEQVRRIDLDVGGGGHH